MRRRGAAHLHSLFSYDGRVALPLLAARLRRRGLDFALLTEHNDGIDAHGVAEIRSAAARCSERGFVVVPGLELRCEGGLHLLSIGALPLVDVGVPLAEAAEAVHREGGLAIWAHPPARARAEARGELISRLDGAEIWNGRRDSRVLLESRAADWLRSVRGRGLPLLAFAGLDLHGPGDAAGATLEVDARSPAVADLLAAIRAGRYRLRLGPWRVASDGVPGLASRVGLALAERQLLPLARRARSLLRGLA